MSGIAAAEPPGGAARHLGPAVLAHVVAVLTVLGEVLQIALVPDAVDSLIPWGVGVLIFTITALVVGWVVAWRRPRMALGWIVLATAFLFGMQGLTLALGDLLRSVAPVPASWLISFGGEDSQYSWLPPIALLFTQVPLRFPTGRLPSRRWRWFSWFTIGAILVSTTLLATTGMTVSPGVANPFFVDWGPATDLVGLLTFGILLPAFIGSIASLFVRHRRADTVERAQLRWVFWAAAVVCGSLVVAWVEGNLFGGENAPGIAGVVSRAWLTVTGIGYSLIPLAILFAVLRYGLYSIDRIISRTVAYAILTIVVIGTYGLVVLLISLLLPGLEHAPIGVALATLAAAGVFLPALRWVRRLIDRVFNRSQYDAERVVVAFGERIRNGADPHLAGSDLVGAVAQTLQPSAIGLWVREGAR